MRVALISHNAQAGDAIGNQLAEKLAFFLERGADVRVFLDTDRRLHPAIRPYHRVVTTRETKGDDWEFLSSADLIIVEYGHSYPLLELLPALVGGKPRILFNYHGVTPAEWWEGRARAAQEAALHRGLVWCADAAVVHSRFTRRELLERTGFPSDRTHQLGHAVDQHQPAAGDGAAFRRWLGLESETLLLFVGRLAPNKRVPVLVETLARLRDRSPAVHGVIIGDKSDAYEAEARRCRDIAEGLGVADRLHLLGHVDDNRLRDAYRAADVLVMPSRHEGFCIPLIEAMASGLLVVAARAGALPETVADAGLTFCPDDPSDLARQLGRVLDSAGASSLPDPSRAPLRVAAVAFRYGKDFAGGAETSLRTVCEALQQAGHHVEVFTTCTVQESNWSNQCPEGDTEIQGIAVHRYRLDPHDEPRHAELIQAILRNNGTVSPEIESDYLRTSIHSSRLLEALQHRIGEFDAVIVGPYLFGLTVDVARAFPEKTLLLPCFHDEPLARLPTFREVYERTAGVFYHSPEEQYLAESEFGLNHPGAVCIGTAIDITTAGNAARGRQLIGTERYLLYCGRYIPQKGVDRLCEYARRYDQEHPGRFTFVFLGQGNLSIPREPWACDLGFVAEDVKRDVLAGADALVLLSRLESLSLVALEAWAQRVPVVADAACEVLVGHLRHGGGGRAIDGYDGFAAALNDLWENPESWRILGAQGQDYVRTWFGSPKTYASTLEEAVRAVRLPLAERMRSQGLRRAARFARPAWREQFGRLIEELLDSSPRPYRERVEIRPRSDQRSVSAGATAMSLPVRVVNRGTHVVSHQGPARLVLRCQVMDDLGRPVAAQSTITPLPGLVIPGKAVAAAVTVPVSAVPGTYRLALRAERAHGAESKHSTLPEAWMTLHVNPSRDGVAWERCCQPMLEAAQSALAEAESLQGLPDDYIDVTEGWLAPLKHRIKRKLLNNFKKAYVDVVSRQQSAFNRRILTALAELTECCATLDHVRTVAAGSGRQAAAPISQSLTALVERKLGASGPKDLAALLESLAELLSESDERCARLEERLARLELRPISEEVAS